MITCTRCGICCKSGICLLGKEDSTGKCIFIKVSDHIYSCDLYSKGIVSKEDIGIGLGCIIRRDSEMFEFYRENYGE